MVLFILGLIVFFGIHHTRQLVPGVRDNAIARFGLQGWKGIYALLSFAGIALIVIGWMQWRVDAPDVYYPPDWGRHVTELLVLIAFILLTASSTPAGHIKQAVVHPMLIGIILWSVGHLFANGDLASVLLWGVFTLSSVWHIIAAEMRGDPHPRSKGWQGDVGAIAIGVILYFVFGYWLHGLLFEVSPF